MFHVCYVIMFGPFGWRRDYENFISYFGNKSSVCGGELSVLRIDKAKTENITFI